MSASFEAALAECLEALERGERTLEECLAGHPEHRERLERYIRLSQDLGRTLSVEPRLSFVRDSHRRLSSRLPERAGWLAGLLERLRFTPLRALRLDPAFRALALTFTVLAVSAATLGGLGVTRAAAEALPGDRLYTMKITYEQTVLGLAVGPVRRVRLGLDLVQRRGEELEALVAQSRVEDLTRAVGNYEGQVHAVAAGLSDVQARDQAASMQLGQQLVQLLGEQAHRLAELHDRAPFQVRGALEKAIRTTALSERTVGLWLDRVAMAGSGTAVPLPPTPSCWPPDSLATPLPGVEACAGPSPTAIAAQVLPGTPTSSPTAPGLGASPSPTPRGATASASPRPTRTASPTTALTPTPSATPEPGLSCDRLTVVDPLHWETSDELEIDIRNGYSFSLYLLSGRLEILDYTGSPPAELDDVEFNGDKYVFGELFESSPFVVSDVELEIEAGETKDVSVDFDHIPAEGIYGRFIVTLVFGHPDRPGVTCTIVDELVGSSP